MANKSTTTTTRGKASRATRPTDTAPPSLDALRETVAGATTPAKLRDAARSLFTAASVLSVRQTADTVRLNRLIGEVATACHHRVHGAPDPKATDLPAVGAVIESFRTVTGIDASERSDSSLKHAIRMFRVCNDDRWERWQTLRTTDAAASAPALYKLTSIAFMLWCGADADGRVSADGTVYVSADAMANGGQTVAVKRETAERETAERVAKLIKNNDAKVAGIKVTTFAAMSAEDRETIRRIWTAHPAK